MRCEFVGEAFGVKEALVWVPKWVSSGRIGEVNIGWRSILVCRVISRSFEDVLRDERDGWRVEDFGLGLVLWMNKIVSTKGIRRTQDTSPSRNR